MAWHGMASPGHVKTEISNCATHSHEYSNPPLRTAPLFRLTKSFDAKDENGALLRNNTLRDFKRCLRLSSSREAGEVPGGRTGTFYPPTRYLKPRPPLRPLRGHLPRKRGEDKAMRPVRSHDAPETKKKRTLWIGFGDLTGHAKPCLDCGNV
jgi:hypothetical protein